MELWNKSLIMENITFNHTSNQTASIDRLLLNIINEHTYSHGFGHHLSSSFSTALGMYFALLSVLATFSNGILFYTLASRRPLHCIGNVFIMSLIVSDILTAVFVVPQDAIFLLKGYHIGGKISCGFKEIFFFFSLPASILNLFFLTAERFVNIVYPYKHSKLFTKQTVTAILIIVWLYTCIVAVFPLLYKRNAIVVYQGVCWIEFPMLYIYFHLAANFMLPILLITIMNIAMFFVARDQSIKIEKQSVLIQQGNELKANLASISVTFSKMLKNTKAAKTVAVLVGVFLFCWLTFVVPAIYNVLCNICHPREVTWSTNAINYLSCLLNPLIYCLFNKQIRKFLPYRKLFARCNKDFRSAREGDNCNSVKLRSVSKAIDTAWV